MVNLTYILILNNNTSRASPRLVFEDRFQLKGCLANMFTGQLAQAEQIVCNTIITEK